VLVIMANTKLEVWDFVAVGCYFVAVLGAGLYVSIFLMKLVQVDGIIDLEKSRCVFYVSCSMIPLATF